MPSFFSLGKIPEKFGKEGSTSSAEPAPRVEINLRREYFIYFSPEILFMISSADDPRK
jgi:hypothetical protein